jgi:hypothetical protein
VRFGQVNLGDTRYFLYSLSYRNVTASTISVSVPAGSDFAIAQASSGTWTTAGETLLIPTLQPATTANTLVDIWIRFTPSLAQAMNLALTHLADGEDERTRETARTTLIAQRPPVALVAHPNSVHFGVVAVNGSSTQTFTLDYQNVGSPITLTLPLGVSARLAGSGANFASQSFAFTPPAFAGSTVIELQYSSTANMVLKANISCSTLGTGATLVAVAGRSIGRQISVNTNSLNFGDVTIGEGAGQTIKIIGSYEHGNITIASSSPNFIISTVPTLVNRANNSIIRLPAVYVGNATVILATRAQVVDVFPDNYTELCCMNQKKVRAILKFSRIKRQAEYL